MVLAKEPGVTKTQCRVLALKAQGYSNEAVGVAMGISTNTVKSHILRAMDRLDADNATHAVVRALQRNLITVPGLRAVEEVRA